MTFKSGKWSDQSLTTIVLFSSKNDIVEAALWGGALCWSSEKSSSQISNKFSLRSAWYAGPSRKLRIQTIIRNPEDQITP